MRAAIGFFAVLVALGGLAAWYFRLQVLQHEDYATRSEANRVRLRPVVPARGLILDRKGRVLAENVPAWRLDIVPDQAGDIAKLVPELSKLIAISPDDIEKFDDARRGARGFKPVTLKARLDDDEVARFAVDRWRFPGVEVVPYLTRRYPYGDLFAHVVLWNGELYLEDGLHRALRSALQQRQTVHARVLDLDQSSSAVG